MRPWKEIVATYTLLYWGKQNNATEYTDNTLKEEEEDQFLTP